jgi:hypothetical protein
MTAISSRSEGAPKARIARVVGGLLLSMAVTAGFAELGVRAALVVPGNADETAARVLASPFLFKLGFVGYLIAFLADVPVAILFFVLLKPVAKAPRVLAAALRIVYAALATANLFGNYLGARVALGVGDTGEQHRAALTRFDAYESGFKLALVLFGLHLSLLGVLLLKSGLLPKAIGWLMVVAGFAYVVDTLTFFASPSVHTVIAPYLAVCASFEIVLAVWLVVKRVTLRSEAGNPPLRRAS